MTQTTRPRRLGLPMVVGALCALVLVASLIVGTVMFLKVRAADERQDDRLAAQSTAEQFALRMDAFNGTDIDGYIKSVEPMLTTRQKTVFTQQIGQFKKVYEQAHKAAKKADEKPGKGKILLSGVTDADADSATVLVAHDSTIAGQAEALHFRWQLSLRKIDGHWLIDDFVPVS